MSSRPWMPLYVGDYLADTMHLTNSQHGSYLLLLMHYWQHDGLPPHERELMAIAKMTEAEWAGNCHVLARFFTKDWRNKRVDFELEKMKKRSAARAISGLKGAWAKHKKYGLP